MRAIHISNAGLQLFSAFLLITSSVNFEVEFKVH